MLASLVGFCNQVGDTWEVLMRNEALHRLALFNSQPISAPTLEAAVAARRAAAEEYRPPKLHRYRVLFADRPC